MTAVDIEEILFEALARLESPAERAALLDRACADDPARRRRLEEMVALHAETEEFFTLTPPEPAAAAVPDEGAAEGPGARIGRYRLVDRLGEGGCGAVYLAEQLEPVHRRVALKIIRIGRDTSGVIARFEMERQALAMMDHPNIARVLDAGATANGRLFFVMQLVDGLRITEFCERHRLDLRQRLRLFIPVCLAIQHAHQKGIVHCDIKPSNVLVTTHDGAAVPKVIDFGIAKATEGAQPVLTDPAAAPIVGTPAYMSPEQAEGNGPDVDTRSDIYSLGVLLYEMLAGVLPRPAEDFENRSPEEIRALLAAAPPPPASERARPGGPVEPRRLRGDLDAILGKAMEPDRQRRYDAAGELAADISRYLENEPVSARRGGRIYRFGRLIHRNKVAFAAGAIVVLALGGGFGTSTWLFVRENQARREQDRLRRVAESARIVEARLREKAQTAEQVAHAAVLLSHGRIEEADALLDKVPPEQVPASLESATVYRTVAEWLLRKGRPAEAADRFGAVAHALGQVDRSDSDSVSIHFVAAAAAVADAGDMVHYEELRNMAARRFAGTSLPIVADEVVKTCLLKPAPPEMLAAIRPLVATLEANFPQEKPDLPDETMEAWQMFSLSLAKYRAGDFPAADQWARRCLHHPNFSKSRSASALAVLALAMHQAGKEDAAAGLRDASQKLVDGYFQEPFQFATDWSANGFWFDWVIARLLLREAGADAGK